MQIYTIGHGKIAMEEFLGLLEYHHIELIADVRSEPVSRWASHFNRSSLERILNPAGIRYAYMGDKLGGRPQIPELYNGDEILYDKLKEIPFYREGIDELLKLAEEQRVCLLCSEEDPSECHRSLLIAQTLLEQGADVIHIRHSGEIINELNLPHNQQLRFTLKGSP